MATTSQLALPARAAGPIALWHLLSLDAPTVAALWTCFVARANHIRLPLASPAAMVLVVWMLYATDRLLDARLLDARPLDARLLDARPLDARLLDARLLDASMLQARAAPPRDGLEARHLFHHRHRRAFLIGIALAAAAIAALLPRLDAAALPLYLVEGALLLAWFLILHATRSAHRLPKEIAVGLFFSAAVFIPTVAREPGLRAALLPYEVLFAALCSLNCLFIAAWEHGHSSLAECDDWRQGARTAHATTRLALAHLNALAMSVVFAGTALAIYSAMHSAHSDGWPVPAGCALTAGLLLVLDRNRMRLSRINLRAAADLALLTPLLLLPFQR